MCRVSIDRPLGYVTFWRICQISEKDNNHNHFLSTGAEFLPTGIGFYQLSQQIWGYVPPKPPAGQPQPPRPIPLSLYPPLPNGNLIIGRHEWHGRSVNKWKEFREQQRSSHEYYAFIMTQTLTDPIDPNTRSYVNERLSQRCKTNTGNPIVFVRNNSATQAQICVLDDADRWEYSNAKPGRADRRKYPTEA